MSKKYYVGMYDFEILPNRDGKAGVGMGLDGEPYQFDSEDEYREWYVTRLQEALVNAGYLKWWQTDDFGPTTQYALVTLDGHVIETVEASDIIKASAKFKAWPHGAMMINLSEIVKAACEIEEVEK